MFGYLVKVPISINKLVEHLADNKIWIEWVSDEIVLHDDAGNRVWAHVDENEVTSFWRTAGNDAASIMQRIADVFGREIFSDLPEYYGEDPLYVPGGDWRRAEDRPPQVAAAFP